MSEVYDAGKGVTRLVDDVLPCPRCGETTVHDSLRCISICPKCQFTFTDEQAVRGDV